MDKRINEMMSLPIKDRLDWKASFLDQHGRRIRFLSIEQRSRTDSEDILQSELPAWFDLNFDTVSHNYTELTEGAPIYFREFMEHIPEHVPTVNVPEPVTRQDVAPLEEPTSSQSMECEIGEDIELNGPVVGETAPPQPSVRNSSSDRSMRIEDLQSSRRAIDISIASSLHRQIDSRSKDIDYKRPRLSADNPINKMSIIAFLLKYQTWDKYGRKIANRSFEAPGQSDWTTAFMIATQLFGEGQA
ncbi:hypothetical protein P9112_008567 [Eukaryota sp. TZLM1-RC]